MTVRGQIIRRAELMAIVAMALACVVFLPKAAGAEKPGEPGGAVTKGTGDASVVPSASAAPTYDRHWYFSAGASNYHPRLKESEAQIDRQVNDLLSWMPGWDEPTTFKDWADRLMLWDLTVAVGRDITPNTSWMVWVGGATATIKNDKHYGPVETDIRFSRTTAFLTLEGYWYPMGKVDYESVADKKGTERISAAFANAKPYLALATGYSFVRAKGDGKFKLPQVGTFMRQLDVQDHHMYQVSPRLGVELPIGRNNSLTAEGMYYFFGPDHSSEYNGPSVCVGFKHRF